MPTTTHSRLHGLDTLRAIAILLVLMYHYMVVVSSKNTFGFLTGIGWTGVDLFFVLSGFLIGNQILSAVVQKKNFSLKTFYIRRLLRTLPNYYVIFALYFIFPLALSGRQTASIWQFLTFTQNFNLHPGETFTHSWSLCIEEQFYLVLPALVMWMALAKATKKQAWIVLCGAISAGVLMRGVAWYTFGQNAITTNDFYAHIYYSSFARFDELLPGVALAMLKNLHAELYQRILRYGNCLLVAGLLAVGTMFYLLSNFLEIDGYGFSFWMTTFGYSLLAVSFALLVLAALSPKSIIYRLQIPGAASLALWSYAIYLAHKPIFKLAIIPLKRMNIDTDSYLGISMIMLASLLGGWLLYRLVETPFMRLRDKLYANGNSTRQVTMASATV